MAKRPPPNVDPERLLELLAVICAEPGLRFDALKARFDIATGREPPWGESTVRRFLTTLRRRGLIDQRDQDDGYFPSGAFFTPIEARDLLDAMTLRGKGLYHPGARRRLETFAERFKGSALWSEPAPYMVEAVGHRTVFSPDDSRLGIVMSRLRQAILSGEAIAVTKRRDPYSPLGGTRAFEVYPAQLIFHDIAWYLLAEDVQSAQFSTFRLDRLDTAMPALAWPRRNAAIQRVRLQAGRALLDRGWGMAVPRATARDAAIAYEEVQVRFSRAVADFVREHPNRYPGQRIDAQPDGSVIYRVDLPAHEPVRMQFRRWVLTWGADARVLAPPKEVNEVARRVRAAAAAYADEAALSPVAAPVS